MNIFKILANGDGTLNEANVSAFLGYLLDPKADHGLGFEFLKAFLEQFTAEEEFDPEKYEYQVFYEQAFKEGILAKQIVDIVVVCYTIDLGTGKESLVKGFLNNSKSVEKIFLIENKIRADSITAGQLERQFNSTASELDDNLNAEIYSIYVTPEDQKFSDEFDLAKLNRKAHLFWLKNDDETSIKSILTNILRLESSGDLEPLNEYTLHTIKAFTKFIETGFKSEKQEEKERVNDGSYTEKFQNLNLSSNIEEKLNILKLSLETINPKLKGRIIGPDLTSKRHPELSIVENGIKLVLNAGYVSRNKVSFGFSVDRKSENSKIELLKLANMLNIDLKKPDDKYGSYCRTDEMKKTIQLTNAYKINESIEKALADIEKCAI